VAAAEGALSRLRREFHARLCREILGRRGGIASVADRGSKASTAIAAALLDVLEEAGYSPCADPPDAGQTAGSRFIRAVADFLRGAFQARLAHLRPGPWEIIAEGEGGTAISQFDQYQHLEVLQAVAEEHPEVAGQLGHDYLVHPDIVIARRPLSIQDVNAAEAVIGEGNGTARFAPLLARNNPGGRLLLHASVSCKWTIRSDRVQNARAEALNLAKHRKGRMPHFVLVTMEPLPSRLASVAQGTGEIDCVYHAALDELILAARRAAPEREKTMLQRLIDGRRLRDISDLPLDLAV